MSDDTIRTYGGWQPPRSAGLLGLNKAGTGVLIVGLFTALIATVVWNLLAGGAVFTVFAIFLGLLLRKDVHGRSTITRATEKVAHTSARRSGQHLLRNGPLGRTDHGSCRLPGLLAPIRVHEASDSWGRPFAVLEVPRTGDYTVVLAAEPDGVSLVDQQHVDDRVAEYGFFLRSLSDQPDVVAAQVTIESAPDTGDALRREVHASLSPDAPEFARAVMDAICVDYPTGSALVRAYVAITLSPKMHKDGRKRNRDEMLRDIQTRLPGFASRLEHAGAGKARPVTAQALTDLVRVAYDPAAAPLMQQARAETGSSGVRWEDAGPSGAQANWDTYRHDGATSISWQMTMAPQGVVQADVLDTFLAPDPRVARKRISLLYRPVSVADSPRMVQKDIDDAAFNLGATNKRPSARDVRRVQLAQITAAEEAAGASLVNFGLIATATVIGSDQDAIDDARAAIENTGAAARLQLRIVTGAQDSAFAASLPLGLVLPKHLTVPTEFSK